MTGQSICPDCSGPSAETPRSHCEDWAQHPNWREQIPEEERLAHERLVRATGNFTCDYCRQVFPLGQRHQTIAATLNPYPEDLDLCPNCDGANDADLREIAEQEAEIEEQRREEHGE